MSLLSRLLGKKSDDRGAARPLWHAIVTKAREPHWYAQCGVADTLEGRFDALALVMALVLLRMEREPELIAPSVRLTELFVEDMDGQLRQSGVGDLSVGKHMGKLMGVLGGRLGTLRAVSVDDAPAFAEAVSRNATLNEAADPALFAAELAQFARDLAALPGEALLAGRLTP